MTTIIVTYGNGKYRVEFRLGTGGCIEGRYLPGTDGRGDTSAWEVRTMDANDPHHVAVITALNTLLAAYDGLDIVTA